MRQSQRTRPAPRGFEPLIELRDQIHEGRRAGPFPDRGRVGDHDHRHHDGGGRPPRDGYTVEHREHRRPRLSDMFEVLRLAGDDSGRSGRRGSDGGRGNGFVRRMFDLRDRFGGGDRDHDRHGRSRDVNARHGLNIDNWARGVQPGGAPPLSFRDGHGRDRGSSCSHGRSHRHGDPYEYAPSGNEGP